MGICPSLSPEERANDENNKNLQNLLNEQLKDLYMYSFAKTLKGAIREIQPRYLFNQGICEDIDKVINLAEMEKEVNLESITIGSFDDEIRNSCLILEDEVLGKKIKENRMSEEIEREEIDTTSFQKNLVENQSLVCQIDIIYAREFQINKYKQSLNLFLKWSSIFQEHAYGGFLKPLYREFCHRLYQIPFQEFDTIVDETSIFVQFMVTIYTSIYQLRRINQTKNGDLFKNENIFNLIMSFMFKKTKIRKFIRSVLQQSYQEKIQLFRKKMEEFSEHDIDFFEVQPKFRLYHSKTEINSLTESDVEKQNRKEMPYKSCYRLVQSLCEEGQTPITKLKIIVAISKAITKQIYQHYSQMKKNVPDLDPDNLTGIIMYLIVKSGRWELYEELKMIEYFTTTNCLTCISGYYLNTFNAALETIMTLKAKDE